MGCFSKQDVNNMARTAKEPDLLDQIIERIEELSQVSDAFPDALWNVLAGEASNYDVIEVLTVGLPEEGEAEVEEPEPEPEPAPRGRRARVEEPEPEPEPAPRSRRARVVEPEPATRRGRR
jgi:hypothetical protein